MKILSFITLLTVAAVGCGGGTTKDKVSEVAISQVKFPPPVVKPDRDEKSDNADIDEEGETQSANVQDTAKKIIKEGDIKFRTENLAKTRSAVLSSLKKIGGYVSEEKEFTEEYIGTRNFTLNVRIPAQHFDQFLNQVAETAEQIDSKNVTITDVTTRYIDMQARLRNRKALETRYLDLLKKSTKMADVLEVEDKLNSIRTEIESEQGQLNYLLKQVAYSSLEITFYVKRADASGNENENRLGRSLKDGWQLMQQLFFGIITLWPIWIVVIVVVYFFRKWRRARKARQL